MLPTAGRPERTTLGARDSLLGTPPDAAPLTHLLLRHTGREVLARVLREVTVPREEEAVGRRTEVNTRILDVLTPPLRVAPDIAVRGDGGDVPLLPPDAVLATRPPGSGRSVHTLLFQTVPG